MTSFIIVGENNEAKSITLTLCEEKGISPLDITTITSDKDSVGIGIIKKIQEKIFLKPLQSSDKAVIIPDADKLTIPAQNALLKLLEEPPAHTYLFLLTTASESLLPTIHSRCKVISESKQTSSLPNDERELYKIMYGLWTGTDIGASLKLAEHLAKDKDKTVQTLKKMIIFIRGKMIEGITNRQEVSILANQAEALQRATKVLSTTNTSPRLVLEDLFLKLGN